MADPEQQAGSSHERASFTLEIETINVEDQWRGIIEAVQGDELSVALTNATTGEEEFTTIDRTQISEKDQLYIAEGASFEWIIGYVDDMSGRRIGVSVIELARPNILSDEEKEEALRAGQAMSEALIAGESGRVTFD